MDTARRRIGGKLRTGRGADLRVGADDLLPSPPSTSVSPQHSEFPCHRSNTAAGPKSGQLPEVVRASSFEAWPLSDGRPARLPALGAAGLLTALADTVRVLAGGRNPDPRHRSLRAVIDWGHQLLDVPEQVLFRRLAIFRRPVGPDLD